MSLTFNPKVEINTGSWTDISDHVYYRNRIQITQGQQDETSQVQPGTCQFTLNNRDGRFSPRNPLSPYYGLIGRNTPVRVSMDSPTSYAWIPGTSTDYVSTPDSAALSITGDIDIRIEVALENWRINPTDLNGNATYTELCGKYDSGTQGSWVMICDSEGKLNLSWSNDGTTFVAGPFSDPLPIPGDGHLAVRATLDVNNGAGGYTVTYYYSDSISGTWTQLSQTVTTSGTTSIFDSTSLIRLGDTAIAWTRPMGKIYAFELRNGIGGSVVANPDFTAQTDGTTSFVDGHSNTWTVNGNAQILKREFRFFGEVASWPSTWDTGGFDVYVPIVANGILRRLGQGARPLQSTLRRKLPSYSPLAYWPMEDGADSTRGANVANSRYPMRTTGLSYASDSTLVSSAALPTFNAASGAITMKGSVPKPFGTLTSWKVQMAYKLATGPATQRTFMRVLSTGTIAEWQILGGTGGWTINAYNPDGSVNFTVTPAAPATSPFGDWRSLRLDLSASGGTVTWVLSWVYPGNTALATSGTYSGTVGYPTTFCGPNAGFSTDLDGMAIGHIAVFPTKDPEQYGAAFDGFAGETAGARMARLEQEESVQVSIFGDYAEEELVGPQGQQTLLSLLQEAADADGGILYERRTLTGLGYRNRETLVNQTAALTVSYTDSIVVAPLQPSGDDFLVRNDITVTRVNGSSATQKDTTSALSVNDPPDGVGDYSTEYTRNLYDDSELNNIASWELHQGTWDEERYPIVNLAVHNGLAKVGDILQLGVGDRLLITDPPAWLPPGDIDLMVIGYTEVFDQFTWSIAYVCIPYGPWKVAVTNDAAARADTDGSVLTSAVSSGATSLSVTTQIDSALWMTSAAYASDFPFDIQAGGEQITVTAITGSASDAFARSTSSGWGTADLGGAWSILAGTTSDFSTSGSYGVHTQSTVGAAHITALTAPGADVDIYCDIATSALATGASLMGGPVARCVDNSNHYMARLEFTTAQAVILSVRKRVAGTETSLNAVTTSLTHVATTFYRVRFQVSGSTVRAKVWDASTTEPSLWTVSATDTSLTAAANVGIRSFSNTGNTNVNPQIRTDNFSVVNPQIFTVTRAVNAIAKAQSASTAVSLYQPSYTGL